MNPNPVKITTTIANWKMHKTVVEATNYITSLGLSTQNLRTRVGVAVPFTAIRAAAEAARGTNILIGSQNVSGYHEGAYTGEVSCAMVKDAGASFCLIGHSERRRLFHEDNATVNMKVRLALEQNLRPVVCIGETIEERKGDKTQKVLEVQLMEGLNSLSAEEASSLILAYEPVWAIGNGHAATPQDAQDAQHECRKILAKLWGNEVACLIPILYGGSVKPQNAEELIKESDVDGFLVGGASLEVETFVKILHCHKG